MTLEGASLSRDRMEKIFSGASDPIERVPMLRVVLERAAEVGSEELAKIAGAPAELVLQGIESGSAQDVLGPLDGASVAGVLFAPKWDARLIVCARREAVFAILELMLGGDGSERPFAAERPITKIETRILGLFFARLAGFLASGFAPISDTPLHVEAVADRIKLDAIGKGGTPVVGVKFRLQVLGRTGEILVAFPKSALDTMRQALSRPPSKPAAKPDARWSEQIRTEVERASVRLSAVLDERMGLLGEISNLRVGQVLELQTTPQSRIRVECNGERLMWCHLGKSNGAYTLRVDSFVDREHEFMQDILAG